jgi:hypothetical protein
MRISLDSKSCERLFSEPFDRGKFAPIEEDLISVLPLIVHTHNLDGRPFGASSSEKVDFLDRSFVKSGSMGMTWGEFVRGTFPELFECTYKFPDRSGIVSFRSGNFSELFSTVCSRLCEARTIIPKISKIDTEFTIPKLFFDFPPNGLLVDFFRPCRSSFSTGMAEADTGRDPLSSQPVHFLQRLS